MESGSNTNKFKNLKKSGTQNPDVVITGSHKRKYIRLAWDCRIRRDARTCDACRKRFVDACAMVTRTGCPEKERKEF